MKKKKQSLLWEINYRKSSSPSYVFGTMHVKDKRAFHYLDVAYATILKCEAFASELNISEVRLNAQENAMELPNDLTLDQLLTKKQYEKLDRIFLKITGFNMIVLNTSLPIVISNLITEHILSKDMPFSLDQDLWNFAEKNEKITLGIESYEEQLALIKKISLDYQVNTLIELSKNFKTHRKQLLKMTSLYQEAKIQELYKSTKKNLKGLRKIMLYDRNENMANRIASMAQEQSIFCAIGAGHLAGKKGVLKKIKDLGFTVRPIHRE